MSESKLTDRQLKAIPFIVTSPTYTEGIQKAGVNRTTFYKWLKAPEFKTELNRQRQEVATEAFGVLQQSLTKATETLAGMLDSKDDKLKRLTANDIINHVLKHKELAELEQRLEALENRLSDRAYRLLRN